MRTKIAAPAPLSFSRLNSRNDPHGTPTMNDPQRPADPSLAGFLNGLARLASDLGRHEEAALLMERWREAVRVERDQGSVFPRLAKVA